MIVVINTVSGERHEYPDEYGKFYHTIDVKGGCLCVYRHPGNGIEIGTNYPIAVFAPGAWTRALRE